MKQALAAITLAAGLAGFAATPAALAAGEKAMTHAVLQVSDNDPVKWNLALNNAQNMQEALGKDKVTIEIVAYGPGITMLRSDNSPVKDRIAETKTAIPGMTLSMCGNAKAGAEKREGHEIIPLPGVQVVPAGIVRIMELEEQDYSYVRP